jgi:hypothetical protein
MTLRKRLAQLEAVARKSDGAIVVAFMVNGASDGDVIAVRSMQGAHAERQPGESLPALVDRVKAKQPLAAAHILFFEYPDELRVRLGKEYMPETLPNTWPKPSHAGQANHLEQLQ